LNTIAALLINRFLPRQRYRLTPVAPSAYQVSDGQTELLKKYDIRVIELHVVDGFYAPVQETRWGDFYRAEDYTFDDTTPNDAFFLRKEGEGYELRLGPAFTKLSPEEVSVWVDSLLKTSISRIEWLTLNTRPNKLGPAQ
jgi:hypothetical protein